MPTRGKSTKDEPAQEVVPSASISAETLKGLNSFADAMALATDMYGEVQSAADELGDGFTLLDKNSKGILVGRQLLFLEWSFNPGDYGGVFVSARVVAQNVDGSLGKYILNDGSTGIAEVLKDYTARTGRWGGLAARNGLRESKYTYCKFCDKAINNPDNDAEHRAEGGHSLAATYYIDTSQ